MILGDLVRRIQRFFGNNKFSREFGGSCDCPGSSCSKMVKIWMKCTLDNLKVIVALRLKISITSCLNTKSSLIWNFKLSHTVTKLFKQYNWVIWPILVYIHKCKFLYVMVQYGKAVHSWTYLCIFSVSQLDLYVWRLIFMYHKEVILTLQLVDI